jgi:hypothetical protein
MDFQIVPQANYKETNHQSAATIGDPIIQVDFQLLNDVEGFKSPYPAIKFFINEMFPLGKYQHLDPSKLLTDSGGNGSYATATGFVFSKLFYFGKMYFLSSRLLFSYNYPAPVHVEDFNIYGGGYGTRAKVYPGPIFSTLLGLEFSLNQNWVFALDLAYFAIDKRTFTGNAGTLNGQPAPLTAKASRQFSLAPAIEYNWSSQFGIIGGVWFTTCGRNSSQFFNWVIAFNYYQ